MLRPCGYGPQAGRRQGSFACAAQLHFAHFVEHRTIVLRLSYNLSTARKTLHTMKPKLRLGRKRRREPDVSTARPSDPGSGTPKRRVSASAAMAFRNIESLPNELVLEVTSYLSKIDQLSLALSQPNFARCLGPKLFPFFPPMLSMTGCWRGAECDIEDFIHVVTSKWPRFWFCYRCCRLHPHEPLQGNLDRDAYIRPLDLGPGGALRSCQIQLKSSLIELVLLRHAVGKSLGCCREYLSQHRSFELGDCLVTASASAEFVNQQLIWQGRWDFSWAGPQLPSSKEVIEELGHSGFVFCLHARWPQMSIWGEGPDAYVEARITDNPSVWKPRWAYFNDFASFRCHSCATAIEVHHRKIEHQDFKSLQTTFQIWKNFGDGHGAWKEHFGPETAQDHGLSLSPYGNPHTVVEAIKSDLRRTRAWMSGQSL
jgi:hypothetical protein